MRRVLVLFLIPLALSVRAQAGTVGAERARLTAEHWLARRAQVDPAAAARVPADCVPFRAPGADRGVIGYHVPLLPRGHVILSTREELPAIKAFSFDTDFDPAAPDGYGALIVASLAATEAFLAEQGGELGPEARAAMARHREGWAELATPGGAALPADPVGPFIASSWHQSAPYNDDCPPGAGGATCVVGCVATSAAMIMKYWEYPAAGEDAHSYQWGGDDSCGDNEGGGLLNADFYDPYDWANIRDSYSGGWTPEEAAAVAELNYEVGVAFEMDYGVCGSGTYVSIGQDIYPTWFRYSPDIEFVSRNGYTADAWWAMIREELDAFPPRPMHYRITSHSIICDGYQEDAGERYYHMNYGWGGGQNAWYALDDVYCPWDGCNYLSEAMLVNIEPLGFFTVDEPAAADVWTHGEPLPAVRWSGAEGEQVVLDLYQGRHLVTRLADWTVNDGETTPAGAVDPAWGTGDDFRVKVIGDDQRFGWSDEFGVYGAGAWSDASAPPVDDAGAGQAAAWGDCDGDGWPDLFLANGGSDNRLFGNQAGAGFADLDAPPLTAAGASRGAAWADYDNDGDLDLYLARTSGEANQLFRNDGGSFVDVTDGVTGDAGYTLEAAWGDYDGDGYVDLYIVNVYAADRLLRNLGGGGFADVTASPLGDAGWGRSANWVDCDGDGDLDLYLVRSSGNKLYRNEGGGVFTESAGASGLADHGNGFGAAWGDFDGDRDLDVYISNDGANRLYRNEGDGTFVDVTSPPLDDAGSGRGVAWGDFDADGKLDLYLAQLGTNKLFQNLGDGDFADSTHPVLGDGASGSGLGWADYDGDGDLDLYVANTDAPNRLLRNDGASGHWLELDLVGSTSNRLGLGARVELLAAGGWQTRLLGAEAGYLSRSAPVLHFGLGSAATVDSLRIHWPAGGIQALSGIAVDQRLAVVEDATPAAASPPAGFAWLGSHPNPFNPNTEILFSLPAPAATRLSIHDLSGRRVRRLLRGETLPAGRHARSWDGRDAAGEALPSGVYFARLEAGASSASAKLLLLK